MKNRQDELLNNLFSEARSQTPKLSFEEISTQFTLSVSGNVSSQLTKKWYSKLFNFNSIIMMILSTIVIATLINVSVNSNPIIEKNHIPTKEETVSNNPKPLDKKTTISSINLTNSDKINTDESEKSALKENESIISIEKPLKPSKNHISKAETSEKSRANNQLLSFQINEYTTLNQLKQMKLQAESHDLNFDYSVTLKKGVIKKLDLTVTFSGDDNSELTFNRKFLGVNKSFNWVVNWKLNEKGQIIDFLHNKELIGDDYTAFNTANLDSNFTRISLIMDENTTENEIITIQKQAQKAGIVFLYKVKFTKNNKIKYLNIKMLGDQNGKRTKLISQFYYKGSRLSNFKWALIWRQNKTGQFIDFDGNGCFTLLSSEQLTVE